ncbi:MAG TPA: HAD hydrolase family protein [Gemmatimonadales bacterium]|jgi:3-deoxy-D-manno-octulosonate 8-phosphate phosphatase (KDO 8-P phosphatase)
MSSTEAAARVRLLALDVDGVLTDNAVYLGLVDGQRVEMKRFDIQDGLGLGLLRGGPIEVVWVSGRLSESTTLRATELKVAELIQVADGHKVPPFADLLARRGYHWDEVAFVGDDLADVPVLRRVGLPIAVANAIDEVKALARYVTHAPGGRGAVREVVTWLLRQRNEYDSAVRHYLGARDDP